MCPRWRCELFANTTSPPGAVIVIWAESKAKPLMVTLPFGAFSFTAALLLKSPVTMISSAISPEASRTALIVHRTDAEHAPRPVRTTWSLVRRSGIAAVSSG